MVKQIRKGTYFTDDLVSIWFDSYLSINGYSNWSLAETYNYKYHNCITLHLTRLKVFPILWAAYFWLGKLSGVVPKAINYR